MKDEIMFLQEGGGIITADSIPDLDEWFWKAGWNDTRWSCSDWVAWHKANKRKYGDQVAGQKFADWWNKQTMGASALDCRTLNSEFRAYIDREGLHDIVWEGAGLFKFVLQPVGTGGDVITGVGRGLGRTARALRWVIPTLVIGTLAYGGYRLYQYERRR